MQSIKTTSIDDIHDKIIHTIEKHWSGQKNRLQTVDVYDPVKGCAVDSPAILLSVGNMSRLYHNQVWDRPDTSAITLDLSIHCILSNRTKGSGVQIEIRKFAAEVFRLVEINGIDRWGLCSAAGDITSIDAQPSEFNPVKEGFESYEITWTQTFYLSYSNDDSVTPLPDTFTLFSSKHPEVGEDYESEYQQLNNFDEVENKE